MFYVKNEGVFPTVDQVPIEYAIIHIAVIIHNLQEEFPQKFVIGSFFKSKLADIVQVYTKLLCNSLCQHGYSNLTGKKNLGSLRKGPCSVWFASSLQSSHIFAY